MDLRNGLQLVPDQVGDPADLQASQGGASEQGEGGAVGIIFEGTMF